MAPLHPEETNRGNEFASVTYCQSLSWERSFPYPSDTPPCALTLVVEGRQKIVSRIFTLRNHGNRIKIHFAWCPEAARFTAATKKRCPCTRVSCSPAKGRPYNTPPPRNGRSAVSKVPCRTKGLSRRLKKCHELDAFTLMRKRIPLHNLLSIFVLWKIVYVPLGHPPG